MNNNIWATVIEVDGNRIKVKFDSGDEPQKLYRYPKNSSPAIGDRAYFINNVCIGIY